jgi:putative transposase
METRAVGGTRHLSDHGVQYTAISFGKGLEKVSIIPSIRTGTALDSAITESFIATLKAELVHRHSFPDREVARSAIFEYLQGFLQPMQATSRFEIAES